MKPLHELYHTEQLNIREGEQYRITGADRTVFVWWSKSQGLTTCQDKPLKKWRDLAFIGWGFIGGFMAFEVSKWLV